jgi:hypothetical protein
MTVKISRQTIQTGSILLILFFLGGCTHTMSPRQIPPVPMESIGPLGPGLSVHLVNDQPLITLQLFESDVGHKWYANYNEWTDFFIQYWGEELTKRGVAVNTQSRNKISVKLDKLWTTHIFAIYNSGMTTHLSSPDNTWRKEFIEVSTSIRRDWSKAIYNTVERLMKDPEVLDRMKP